MMNDINWARFYDNMWQEEVFVNGHLRTKSPNHVCFVEQPDGSIAELTRIR